MDINRQSLQVLFQGLSTQFKLGLQNPPMVEALTRLTTPTTSETAAEVFGFMMRTMGWKEWPKNTDRQLQNVKSDLWRVESLTYESTVAIPFQDLADDHLGLYSPMVQYLGYAWLNKKLRMLCNMVIDNADCCIRDSSGVYTKLFANTHAYGAYNIDNDDTQALSKTSYVAARTAMSGWRYDNGDPTGSYPSVLLCGPTLQQTAQELLQCNNIVTLGNEFVAGSKSYGTTTNVLMGDGVVIIVRPEFGPTSGSAGGTDASNYWALFDTSKPLKPFLWINRMEPSIIGPSDPEWVYRLGRADYLGTARGALTPTMPHFCFRNVV
jgi:phage major head subunit gpT-like protein